MTTRLDGDQDVEVEVDLMQALDLARQTAEHAAEAAGAFGRK